MDVKAAIAFEAGESLKVETVQLEGPKAGEVLVEIKSTGVCHTDEYTRSGADPEGPFPSVLGHAGAGDVEVAGPGGRGGAGGGPGRPAAVVSGRRVTGGGGRTPGGACRPSGGTRAGGSWWRSGGGSRAARRGTT